MNETEYVSCYENCQPSPKISPASLTNLAKGIAMNPGLKVTVTCTPQDLRALFAKVEKITDFKTILCWENSTLS